MAATTCPAGLFTAHSVLLLKAKITVRQIIFKNAFKSRLHAVRVVWRIGKKRYPLHIVKSSKQPEMAAVAY